jgi:hypothetical protein
MSHDEHGEPAERDINVSHELEGDLNAAELAVEEYLGTLGDSARNALITSLERLDELSAASDAYQQRFVVPYPLKSSVVGATSLNPIVEEVPGTIFEAQVDLVKVAKRNLTKTTAESLADLRSALATLKEMREPSE